MWHASILVRALATGERHTCSAHIPFEAVGVALVIGLDRSGLPSALSVSPAPSTDPAALDGPPLVPPRCSAASRLYNLAVAAADHRTLDHGSEEGVLAAMSKRPVVCGHHSKILSVQRLRKLSGAIESRWVTGVRADHGQGAGRAGAVEADGEGCPDALERYVRVACVSLCRSVSSHENARVPHTAVPWQVGGWLQRLYHESILSIC